MQQQLRNHHLDKKLIGTLFEEEEVGKKDNYHNQVARDEKGRKHWQGAFTGGFIAGYKNTCGSRDGWAPQTFLSSRNNRAQMQAQTVEKFIDQEDVGHQIIGVNLLIRPEFDSYGTNEGVQPKNQVGYQFIQKLLKEQKLSGGFIQQQKIQNDSSIPMPMPMPEDTKTQEENIDRIFSQSNDQYLGLGFTINPVNKLDKFADTLSPSEQHFKSFVYKYYLGPNEQEELQRKKDNKVMFSGGDNENEEEYFYEIPEEQDDKKKHKKVKTDPNNQSLNLNDIFVSHSQGKVPGNKHQQQKNQYRIDVPNDYDPYHRIKNLVKSGIEINKILLTRKGGVQERRKILGEEEETIKQETAVNIRKDLDRKQFVRGTTDQPSLSSSGIKIIYPTEPQKQLRFEHFCCQKEGKIIEEIPLTNNLTEEKKQEEFIEFERVYQMFIKDPKNVSNEPVQDSIQNANLTQKIKVPFKSEDPLTAFRSQRTSRKWAPAPLVCIRLGCVCPYSDDEIRLINKFFKKKGETEKDIDEEPKERFTWGGVYREWDEEVTALGSLDQRKFDPSMLGLPLSFKSMSMQRNQEQMIYQNKKQQQQQSEAVKREQPNNNKNKHQEEIIPDIQKRTKDVNLFDSIFGE